MTLNPSIVGNLGVSVYFATQENSKRTIALGAYIAFWLGVVASSASRTTTPVRMRWRKQKNGVAHGGRKLQIALFMVRQGTGQRPLNVVLDRCPWLDRRPVFQLAEAMSLLRFHHPPPRAWNSAAVSPKRVAWACTKDSIACWYACSAVNKTSPLM